MLRGPAAALDPNARLFQPLGWDAVNAAKRGTRYLPPPGYGAAGPRYMDPQRARAEAEALARRRALLRRMGATRVGDEV